MVTRRDALLRLWGLALLGWFLSLTGSPAMALPVTSTSTDILAGQHSPTGPTTGLVRGLGGSLGSSLADGFPHVVAFGNNLWSLPGVIVDGVATRADNASRLTLNTTRYLAAHWAAASSGVAPVTFSLAADVHSSLSIDGNLVFDRGDVKAISPSVLTALASTGQHRQSGIAFWCPGCLDAGSTAPEPAGLLLFGAALVGIGLLIRRRTRGAVKANI